MNLRNSINSYYKILAVGFVFLFLNSSLLIPHCLCQWVRMPLGSGNEVSSFASSGDSILAAIYGNDYKGVYSSTDYGTTWTKILNDKYYGKFHSIAVNGNNVFASAGQRIYISTNQGVAWNQFFLKDHHFGPLAVNGNFIFAGTSKETQTGYSGAVYLSTDNGASWTQTSLNNHSIFSLAVSGTNVFAGAFEHTGFSSRKDSGLYSLKMSTDNGTTWTEDPIINLIVSSLAVSGTNIFAGSYLQGVDMSTDNGIHRAQTSLSNQTIRSLAVKGNNVFAGTLDSGVYVSNDNGSNWTKRNEGLGNVRFVDALA